MKKLIFLFMTAIIIVLLASCSERKPEIRTENTYIFGQDNQYMYSDIYGSPLQKVEGGYVYYMSGFLYFVDVKSGKAQPLCDKPDCLHEKERNHGKADFCRAYIGITEGRDNVQYYDGGIYYPISVTDDKTAETHFYIRRYDLKTFSVEDITELNTYPSEGFIVHRGYVYIEMYKEPDEGGNLNETELYKIDLNGDKAAQPVCDFNESGLAMLSAVNLQAYGNYVYFDAECVKLGTDLADSDNDSFEMKRYGYNIQSGELVCISDIVKNKEPHFCGYYKGKLLYVTGDNRVYQADLDGRGKDVLFEYDKKYYGYNLFTDGKHFYFIGYENNPLSYDVFSAEGEFLNKVELPFAVDTDIGYDADYIIRLVNNRELKIIDKSKITTVKKLEDKLLYTFKNVIVS